jgi:hypothetical protein
MLAMGVREEKSFIVVSAPQRSRGCAEVGQRKEGRAVVIAMAPPSRYNLRRLARLLEHELGHTRGLAHDDMEEGMLWSLGPVPSWARGTRMRYRKRAPSQL